MRLYSQVLLATTALLGFFQSACTSAEDDYYAVLRVAIREADASVVVRETAASVFALHSDFDERISWFRDRLEEQDPPVSLDAGTLESYRSVYRDTTSIGEAELGISDVTLITTELYKQTHQQIGPPPEPIVTLSSVGFNPERTQAVLEYGVFCGSLCGVGYFLVLEKENFHGWRIVAKIHTWSS